MNSFYLMAFATLTLFYTTAMSSTSRPHITQLFFLHSLFHIIGCNVVLKILRIIIFTKLKEMNDRIVLRFLRNIRDD